MSATIQTIITCDGSTPHCAGSDWSADSSHKTAAEQRRMAKEQLGWRFCGGKDYCPDCWAHLFNLKKSNHPPNDP